jgi:hypothetical protein
VSTVHPEHSPELLQTSMLPQSVPDGLFVCTGVPLLLHVSVVQLLLSFCTSVVSTTDLIPPWPSHTFL